MGMTMSLIVSLVAGKMVSIKEKINSVVLVSNLEEDKEIEEEKIEDEEIEDNVIEEKKEIKFIDLEPNINIDYNYEVIGDKSICSDVLFTDKYTDLEGISTFRGNNFRNTASYGVAKASAKELNVKWKTTTSFS